MWELDSWFFPALYVKFPMHVADLKQVPQNVPLDTCEILHFRQILNEDLQQCTNSMKHDSLGYETPESFSPRSLLL
jgi:hypothetical protein